jgi:hypothetical protein
MGNNDIKVRLTINMESGALVREGERLYNKPSFKVINLGVDCYNFYKSYDSQAALPGSFYSIRKQFRSMGAQARLEAWFQVICAENRGKSYNYHIFED